MAALGQWSDFGLRSSPPSQRLHNLPVGQSCLSASYTAYLPVVK